MHVSCYDLQWIGHVAPGVYLLYVIQSIDGCSPRYAYTHIHISKKYFRPGGKAPSEWTRSVRAFGDTPVADCSAPGLNTMRRVAYYPPIAVSLVLLALSVSYFKQTLWRWGQL